MKPSAAPWLALLFLLSAITVPTGGQERNEDAALGDNAALLYLRAFLVMPEDKTEGVDFPRQTDPDTVNVIRERLDAHKDALALVRRAALMERVAWGVEMETDASRPHLALLRRIARRLNESLHLHALDGDLDGALEDADTLLRAGRHLMEPTDGRTVLVENLVGIAIAHVGYNALGQLATPERAARIEDFLATRPPWPERLWVARALEGEKECVLNYFARVLAAEGKPDGELLSRPLLGIDNRKKEDLPEIDAKRFVELATPRCVESMDNMIALMQRPLAEALAGLDAYDAYAETVERRQRDAQEARDKVAIEITMAEAMTYWTATMARAAKAEATLRTYRVMLQAGAARRRGATPEELARFVDPVQGRPFRYIDDKEDDCLYVVSDVFLQSRDRYPSMRLGPLRPGQRAKIFTPDHPEGHGAPIVRVPPPPAQPAPVSPAPVAPAPEPRPAPPLAEEVF